MAENKKSFVLYADLITTVGKLPDEIAGKLFKIVLEYVNDLDPAIDDLLLSVAFEPIKLQLKRDLKKYDSKREQWSDAGKKSAEARRKLKELSDLNKIKSTDVEKRSTVSTVNDTVTVTVIQENIQKKFLKPTIQEVRDYCNERKNSVNPARFVDFYDAKGWKIGKNVMKDWRAAVRTWEKNPDDNNNDKKLRLNGSDNF